MRIRRDIAFGLTVLLVVAEFWLVGGMRVAVAAAGEWATLNAGLWGSHVTAIYQGSMTSSQLLLAGTAEDGMFRSVDRGAHWTWSGEGLPNLGTAVRPRYPHVTRLEAAGGVVYASTDAGVFAGSADLSTWTARMDASSRRPVYCVLGDTSSASVLYVGTDDGVYQTVDAGLTWTARNVNIQRLRVLQLSYDASMGGKAIFAATTDGLFKSLDGAKTWLGLGTALRGAVVQCLVQNTKSSGMLFAGTSTGVLRSYDGGETWSPLKLGSAAAAVISLAVDSFEVNALAAASSQGILVSHDSGETWAWVYHSTIGIPCEAVAWNAIAPSLDVFVGDRLGLKHLAGTDISSPDNVGLGWLDIGAIAYDPYMQSAYAVRNGALYKSVAGSAWSIICTDLGNSGVTALTVDETRPRVLYAATQYGLLRSTDGGASWAQLAVTPSDPRGKILSVAVEPGDASLVYSGNDFGLYRNDEGFGSPWPEVGPKNSGAIISVAVSQSDRNTVYALAHDKLWRSADRAASWQVASDLAGVQQPVGIAVDSDNPGIVYLSTLRGIMRSDDGGHTWHAVTFPGAQAAEINSLALLPGGSMFVATTAGVWGGTPAVDMSPPVIVITSPADQVVVRTSPVRVTGTVADAGSGVASLTVGGVKATVAAGSGAFDTSVPVQPGMNDIVIAATDAAGNTSQLVVHIRYAPVVVILLQVGSSVMKLSDGTSRVLDAPPVIASGRTLVAIRPIVETLGGSIVWSAAERKVTVTLQGTQVLLWIDQPGATVNGVRRQIDTTNASVVPRIMAGRTMLPLRFVAEALGATVDWTASTQTITITYPAP